jgi:hypothetical protein
MIMPVDIIIDDRALAVAIDVKTGNSKQKMNVEDEEELKKSIQQNREIIQRMRSSKKYEGILQKV